MRRICMLVVVVAALTLTTAAQARTYTARTLSDAHVGSSKTELVAQRDFSAHIIRSLRRSWTVAPRHATCWSHVPWSRTCDRARRRLHAHRWLHDLAVRRLAKFYPTVTLGPAWLVSDFICIHHYEGSWTDSGAPYWGGLQFGWNEWQRFGGRYAPTADRATAAEQIAAAIAYWRVSGFSPWPQTARKCGLL